MRIPLAPFLLSIACVAPAFADCQQQLQQLSADLRGVALSETQKQKIGGIVDDARRWCWIHREEPAMEYIARARDVAGLKAATGEFDWETVPLDSLERTPPTGAPVTIKR
ncbi:MAG TPA: hypothetical protein VHB46_08235 [Burkholderiales bacterium]|nr:hypothetical protein [Burkholderiales bacterium]